MDICDSTSYKRKKGNNKKNMTFVTDRLPLLSIVVIDKTCMCCNVLNQTENGFPLRKKSALLRKQQLAYSPLTLFPTPEECIIFIQNENPSSIQFVLHLSLYKVCQVVNQKCLSVDRTVQASLNNVIEYVMCLCQKSY